jgi:PEP-CTERM motif
VRHRRIPFVRICVLTCACIATMGPAHADSTWVWNYSGTGVTAGGTFSTTDVPNADGFYQIISITGSRNGDTITGLFPTGFAIPGNEPFAVDNLIRIDEPGQITVEGFGYSLASGGYANPYYADFLSPPSYSEVFTHGATFSETAVSAFNASPVPEPAAFALLLTGLFGIAIRRASRVGDAEPRALAARVETR